MKTLNLEEAAEFLKMHPEALRRKAKSGNVPGRKIGRCWVFVKEHLADFISGRYPEPRRDFKVIDGGKLLHMEKTKCQSINAAKTKSGGSISPHKAGTEYANLLGLK